MFKIQELIQAIESGNIWVTDHADEEASNDRLTYEEIFSSIANGEIIEEYPEDSPYPSVLFTVIVLKENRFIQSGPIIVTRGQPF